MELILVGYDGSPGSGRALSRAAEVAEAFSAKLVVVSVADWDDVSAPEVGIDPYMTGAGVEILPPVSAPSLPRDPGELAGRALTQAREVVGGRKVEAEFVAETGEARDRLLELARERQADLIVLGNHEHGFFERLRGTSVDQALVQHAPCDVLLVR